MDKEQMLLLAKKIGFEAISLLNPATLIPKKEVRDMCASGKCKQYAKRWSCPPGCGSLEECKTRLSRYSGGLLLQSIGQLEDCFDGEGIMRIEKLHKKRLSDLRKCLPTDSDVLVLGAGCCLVCAQCTYPDTPCRFPRQMMSSIEAYGLLVSEINQKNGIPYYYGPDKLSYTGCLLF